MLKKYFVILFFIVFVSGYLYSQAPNEIRYNGKLKEYGEATNGTKAMRFVIYDQPSGGKQIGDIEETNVNISNGIFSCTLKPNISQEEWGTKNLYLEISIDGKVLSPREKLTSVPYSLHSTSADNITQKTAEQDFSVNIGGMDYYLVPKGAIIIWSGSVNNIPSGWALCDGTNGTPNLTDKFVLGAGGKYSVKDEGGKETHTLTVDEMPSHSHNFTVYAYNVDSSGSGTLTGGTNKGNIDGQYSGVTEEIGSSKPHNNMPPYYALCYIMRK